MTPSRVLLVVLVAVLLGGCATSGAPPPPRGSQPPRVRCLSDPHETGTRALLFLFCIENP